MSKLSENKKRSACIRVIWSTYYFENFTFFLPTVCVSSRAEGSSKIHSRLEQQTSRLSQQMRSNNSGSSNKSSASSKSSPPKEKTSPASPMDDIERGDVLSVFIQIDLY